jgi:hypothetical protein
LLLKILAIYILLEPGVWSNPIPFKGKNGWTPSLGLFEYDSNTVLLEIVGFYGGSGDPPVLEVPIGMLDPRFFLTEGGYTPFPENAINLKGKQGDPGTNNANESTVFNTSYLALEELKAASLLTPKRFYRFEFTTIHLIEGTIDINSGVPEFVIIQAITNNRFEEAAKSELYPYDIIHYDFDNKLAEDGITPRPGYITYREDTLKRIDCGYDFRNVRFRLRHTSLYHEKATKENDSLFQAQVYYNGIPISYYSEYYIDFSDITTHAANPTLKIASRRSPNNSQTKNLVKKNLSSLAENELPTILGARKIAFVYYSPLNDKFIIEDSEIETQMCEWKMGLVPDRFFGGNVLYFSVPDPDVFEDVLTFPSADPVNCFDVHIEKNYDDVPNRIIFLDSAANVHFDGTYCKDIVFKGYVNNFHVNHAMYECRFSGNIQGQIDAPTSYIFACATGGNSRLNLVLGKSGISSVDTHSMIAIFSRGSFNAIIDYANSCTFRISPGINRNWRIGAITDCTFNFKTKPVSHVFITGHLNRKYFIDTFLDGTTYLGGVDEVPSTYESNDIANVTINKNSTIIMGSPNTAGVLKMGFLNSQSKSYLQWNPTASRTIDIPDVNGLLAVLQTFGSNQTLILDKLPTSSIGLQPGTVWNDGGSLKIA